MDEGMDEADERQQSFLISWPLISVAYSRRKSRSEDGLRASCGPLKLRPPLQPNLSGAKANLPEGSAYILSAQLPRSRTGISN